MTASPISHVNPFNCVSLAVAVLVLCAAPATAATTFALTATNVEIDQPAPLFTTTNVTGNLTISGTNGPNGAFGINQVAALDFNFAGIIVTLSDITKPGGDIVVFGNIAPDGKSITAIDLRFDLPTTFVPCSFDCSGQLEIGNFDNSNFVAIDDLNAETLSFV